MNSNLQVIRNNLRRVLIIYHLKPQDSLFWVEYTFFLIKITYSISFLGGISVTMSVIVHFYHFLLATYIELSFLTRNLAGWVFSIKTSTSENLSQNISVVSSTDFRIGGIVQLNPFLPMLDFIFGSIYWNEPIIITTAFLILVTSIRSLVYFSILTISLALI